MLRVFVAAVAFFAAVACSWAGEPGGTPDDMFFSEAALAAAAGIAFFVGGYAVGGDPQKNEGTDRETASYFVYGAAPLASALGIYVYGENVGHRSANRPQVLLATAGTFYGLVGGAAAVAYAVTEEDKDAGALTAAFYAVIPSAFAGAAVYNALKKPYFYEIPGYSAKILPSYGVYRSAEKSKVIPTLGIEVWF
ncbi:MAG: hypothetical protein JSU81_09120 [Candidatus Coatesbacteria bacterium]|nr:MAG: hypothetical protein JSU81_09120 [Candidatus Coatesbacteria bacterium]